MIVSSSFTLLSVVILAFAVIFFASFPKLYLGSSSFQLWYIFVGEEQSSLPMFYSLEMISFVMLPLTLLCSFSMPIIGETICTDLSTSIPGHEIKINHLYDTVAFDN